MCSVNYIDVISGNVSSEHIPMLLSVPPHLAISKIVEYVKGKSSKKPRGEFQGLRKRYLGQHLWTSGYFVAMSRQISAKDVRKYIEAQEVHHKYNNFRISEF